MQNKRKSNGYSTHCSPHNLTTPLENKVRPLFYPKISFGSLNPNRSAL